jgi:HD-GYP domain-containing protein (c-di-GMP phosphodiesterase class II)
LKSFVGGGAGTQFDPQLVEVFIELLRNEHGELLEAAS